MYCIVYLWATMQMKYHYRRSVMGNWGKWNTAYGEMLFRGKLLFILYISYKSQGYHGSKEHSILLSCKCPLCCSMKY